MTVQRTIGVLMAVYDVCVHARRRGPDRGPDRRDQRRHPAAAGRGVPGRYRSVTVEDIRRARAGRLQDELDTLREEVIYLKVKLRKESTVSRSEYTDLRDQLQELRARARGDSRTPASAWQRAPADTSSGASGSASDLRRASPPDHHAADAERYSRRPGNRRSHSDRADVGHRPGRGSVRSDDRGRPVSGRSRAHPGRLGDARPGDVGESGVAHRPQGQPHGRVQPDHRSRPQLPDARHGRPRRSRAPASRARRPASAPARPSAPSSAASSVA